MKSLMRGVILDKALGNLITIDASRRVRVRSSSSLFPPFPDLLLCLSSYLTSIVLPFVHLSLLSAIGAASRFW